MALQFALAICISWLSTCFQHSQNSLHNSSSTRLEFNFSTAKVVSRCGVAYLIFVPLLLHNNRPTTDDDGTDMCTATPRIKQRKTKIKINKTSETIHNLRSADKRKCCEMSKTHSAHTVHSTAKFRLGK